MAFSIRWHKLNWDIALWVKMHILDINFLYFNICIESIFIGQMIEDYNPHNFCQYNIKWQIFHTNISVVVILSIYWSTHPLFRSLQNFFFNFLHTILIDIASQGITCRTWSLITLLHLYNDVLGPRYVNYQISFFLFSTNSIQKAKRPLRNYETNKAISLHELK